jgi:hypothetical protein
MLICHGTILAHKNIHIDRSGAGSSSGSGGSSGGSSSGSSSGSNGNGSSSSGSGGGTSSGRGGGSVVGSGGNGGYGGYGGNGGNGGTRAERGVGRHVWSDAGTNSPTTASRSGRLCCFDVQGEIIATGSTNGAIRFYRTYRDGGRIKSEYLMAIVPPSEEKSLCVPITALKFSACSKFLAAGTLIGRVIVFNVVESGSLNFLTSHDNHSGYAVTALCWSPMSQTSILFSGCKGGLVYEMNVEKLCGNHSSTLLSGNLRRISLGLLDFASSLTGINQPNILSPDITQVYSATNNITAVSCSVMNDQTNGLMNILLVSSEHEVFLFHLPCKQNVTPRFRQLLPTTNKSESQKPERQLFWSSCNFLADDENVTSRIIALTATGAMEPMLVIYSLMGKVLQEVPLCQCAAPRFTSVVSGFQSLSMFDSPGYQQLALGTTVESNPVIINTLSMGCQILTPLSLDALLTIIDGNVIFLLRSMVEVDVVEAWELQAPQTLLFRPVHLSASAPLRPVKTFSLRVHELLSHFKKAWLMHNQLSADTATTDIEDSSSDEANVRGRPDTRTVVVENAMRSGTYVSRSDPSTKDTVRSYPSIVTAVIDVKKLHDQQCRRDQDKQFMNKINDLDGLVESSLSLMNSELEQIVFADTVARKNGRSIFNMNLDDVIRNGVSLPKMISLSISEQSLQELHELHDTMNLLDDEASNRVQFLQSVYESEVISIDSFSVEQLLQLVDRDLLAADVLLHPNSVRKFPPRNEWDAAPLCDLVPEEQLSNVLDEVDHAVSLTAALLNTVRPSALYESSTAGYFGDHNNQGFRKLSLNSRNGHVSDPSDDGQLRGAPSEMEDEVHDTSWLMDVGGTWLEAAWETAHVPTCSTGPSAAPVIIFSREQELYHRLRDFESVRLCPAPDMEHDGVFPFSSEHLVVISTSSCQRLPSNYWRRQIFKERTVMEEMDIDQIIPDLTPVRHRGTYSVDLFVTNGCGIIFEFIGDGVPAVAGFKPIISDTFIGPAEACGLIGCGDVLVAIDEEYLCTRTLDAAATMISQLEFSGEV